MQFRFLEYFVALAEEKHFARAAERCNVTQPTLSAGIAGLEGLLGKRLVQRDRRFIDLTPEGHAILPHVRQLIAGHEELRQSINAAGPLRGELRLGAIPAAMPYVGGFVGALHARHPELRVAVRQLTSATIVAGIANFELDAGLTYLDGEPGAGTQAVALFEERFCFATHANGRFGAQDSVTLAEAVSEPLCLLHHGMQNRRILDRHLARMQLAATPAATTDSYLALLSMVAHGGLSSIVTNSHSEYIGAALDVRLLEISDLPDHNHIALIVPDREPLSPIARAALTTAQALIDDSDHQ
jgi:DNA-binding transcriptional LysR family regulator